MTRLLASSLVLLIAAVGHRPANATSPDSALVRGGWVGGYQVSGPPISIVVRFRIGPRGLAGVLSPRVPAGDTASLVVTASGERVRFTAGSGAAMLRFSGTVTGPRMRGEVVSHGGSGRFELALVRATPVERLQDYVGGDDVGAGRIVVIGRSLGQLHYLEPEAGTQGPLYAVGDDAFIGGPTVGTTYPIAAAFDFARDAHGEVTAVRWRDPAGRERVAARVPLYDEREVTFASDSIRLTGSVIVPRTPGLHPGVVLVHGSNAQSRNGQRSIYRFHADAFARRGIAVLIYDKRGIGGSTGHWDDAGLERDALAALRVLRADPTVDSSRVGLWGLSQGAWLVGQTAGHPRRGRAPDAQVPLRASSRQLG